ncbi:MAG: restriction endonuclease subunit S [Deltaproteobacteria bacterium]|nr:restriction endonuclease subunit S [Deltaproteobacteria bacterium]
MNRATVAIDEFCQTGSGSTPPREHSGEYYGGSIPWVKSGELRDGVLTSTEEFVTDEGVRSARLKLVPAGSILVAMYGATVGRTALLGMPATTNQAICHIRPDPSRADARYVWHALQEKLPELLQKRVGGAQPNINQETIKSTRIRLPSLSEQRRTADMLDKADAIRRKRKEAIALTDGLLRATFLNMFGDPVKNPKGWEVRRLEDLVELIDYGVTASAIAEPAGPKFLRITDIQDNHVDWKSVPYCECDEATAARAMLRPGDIVFARTGATTGKSFWISECPDKAVFASYLIRVRPGPRLLPAFLAEFFQSEAYWSQIRSMAEGAAQPGVNASKLGGLLVPVPPMARQRELALISETILGVKRRIEAAIAEADILFDSLVHRAFNGVLSL